ncbi:MAG: SDR family NAD(P)-dependent oxidoreductase [Hyphomonadaceae bacterium]
MQGKVVAITGGFGALGAAVGARLKAQGYAVALIDRAAARPADDGFFRLGDVDISTAAGAQAAVRGVVDQFARLDALINIAGSFRWEKFAEGDLATWDFLYAVNLKTAAAMSHAALPHLLAQGGGRIVNIAAAAALKAGEGMGPYAASKAGVIKLTEALAAELKDAFVTVNAIAPSVLDTPANRRDMPDADFSRWVALEDVAALIAFLLSPEARAVTGALIPITGRV